MTRAAGTYEDMRTGPHHVYRIEGGNQNTYYFFYLSLNDKILLPQFEDLSSNISKLTTLSCPYVQKLKIQFWNLAPSVLLCLLTIWDYCFVMKFPCRHIYLLTFFSAVGFRFLFQFEINAQMDISKKQYRSTGG